MLKLHQSSRIKVLWVSLLALCLFVVSYSHDSLSNQKLSKVINKLSNEVNHNKYPFSIEKLQLPYQVTSSGFDTKCYWSPDGEHIAFLTSEYTFKPYVQAVYNELWYVQEDGFSLYPLIRNKDFVNKTVWETSWLSDSKHILTQIRDGGGEI
jgi:hypothetical protein